MNHYCCKRTNSLRRLWLRTKCLLLRDERPQSTGQTTSHRGSHSSHCYTATQPTSHSHPAIQPDTDLAPPTSSRVYLAARAQHTPPQRYCMARMQTQGIRLRTGPHMYVSEHLKMEEIAVKCFQLGGTSFFFDCQKYSWSSFTAPEQQTFISMLPTIEELFATAITDASNARTCEGKIIASIVFKKHMVVLALGSNFDVSAIAARILDKKQAIKLHNAARNKSCIFETILSMRSSTCKGTYTCKFTGFQNSVLQLRAGIILKEAAQSLSQPLLSHPSDEEVTRATSSSFSAALSGLDTARAVSDPLIEPSMHHHAMPIINTAALILPRTSGNLFTYYSDSLDGRALGVRT